MPSDVRCDAKVALVTGCARPMGVGNAIAKRLAADGIAVAISDVDLGGARNKTAVADTEPAQGLAGLAAEIAALGGTAHVVCGDVSSVDDADRMVRETLQRFGRLDVLVNNAAAPKRDELGDIETIDPGEWDRVMAVNARGPFLMSRAAIPAMKEARAGRIVMISSLAGRVGLRGQAIYGASKHAMIGLARSLALDIAGWGITANAICPGPIHTDRVIDGARRVDDDVAAELQRRAAAIPVGRLGQGSDIAAAVAFLASDESGFVTGQVLGVDGGVHPAA